MSSPDVILFRKEELENLCGVDAPEEIQETVSELKRLHDELESSKGEEYKKLRNDIERAQSMHQDNYRELMNAITHYESNPGIWIGGDDEQVQSALMDFTRAFHNYLAMCKSLRDHTYRAKNKLEKDRFDNTYHEML